MNIPLLGGFEYWYTSLWLGGGWISLIACWSGVMNFALNALHGVVLTTSKLLLSYSSSIIVLSRWL